MLRAGLKRCFHSVVNGERTTHFGFQTVLADQKAKLVGDVFHRVANKYDLMNDLMSVGIHRIWKEQFMWTLDPLPGTQLLDVAGGTGDIAFRFLEYVRSKTSPTALPSHSPKRLSSVVVCDINQSMLDVGEKRAIERQFDIYSVSSLCNMLAMTDGVVSNSNRSSGSGDMMHTKSSLAIGFMCGDAQALPFANASFDAYTISFGLRNVTDVDLALREAHRVLRKGGRFLCLEFSQVANPVLRQLYDAYSFNVIPALGELVSQDRASYQYLVESIRKFPAQDELQQRMEKVGFQYCSYTNLSAGIAAIHSGFKTTA